MAIRTLRLDRVKGTSSQMGAGRALLPIQQRLHTQSTPLLHALPDLHSAFPIDVSKHGAASPLSMLSRSPSAAALRRRRRRPGHHPSQTPPSPVRLPVDGRAEEHFQDAFELVRSRPRSELVNASQLQNAGMAAVPPGRAARILLDIAALQALVREQSEALDRNSEMLPRNGVLAQKRNLYAFCLNGLFRIDGLYLPAYARFVADVFRRYDDNAREVALQAHAGKHKATSDVHFARRLLEAKVADLQKTVDDARDDRQRLAKQIELITEQKEKVEQELELYKKFVFVKTGRMGLDWGRPIPNGDLPTLQFMRDEYPTQAAMLEARIQAAAYTPGYGCIDVDSDDDDDDDVVATGKAAISDALDDIELRSKQIATIWDEAPAPQLGPPADPADTTKE